MEQRINKKIETHQLTFKQAIQEWIVTKDIRMMSRDGTNYLSNFMQFIFDYENIILDKNDFIKRKRLKNVVPSFERCTACRASGEQCTRRRKDGLAFCGTHVKGTPHGFVANIDNNEKVSTNNLHVWVQDIGGIQYYIDSNNNVYMPADILTSSNNPRKVGTWRLTESGEYIIPEFAAKT